MALYLIHIGDLRWHMSPVAASFWTTTLQQYPKSLGPFHPIVHRDWDAVRAVANSQERHSCCARMSLLDPWAFLAMYSSIETDIAEITSQVGPHAAHRLRIYSRVMEYIGVCGPDLDDRAALRLAFEGTLWFELPDLARDEVNYIALMLIGAGKDL